MTDLPDPHSILPFVPAKDFERSTAFYEAMGFQVAHDDDVRLVELGDFGFLLQDFWVKDWGDNFMLAMHVDDAQAWVDRFDSVKADFPGTWSKPPVFEDWGMIVGHFTDPTGVLWHLTQVPPD